MVLRDLFVDHVAAALERQLDLGERIGPCEWNFDMEAGTMTFSLPSEDRVVPVQVLGSESDATGTWIWAWETSRIPARLAESARRLRTIGEQKGARELHTPRVSLATADGEMLALLASGLLNAPGYYRAPFRGGAMFVLLEDASLRQPPARPAVRVSEVFPQAAGLLAPAEQHRALTAYLRHHGFRVEGKSPTLRAELGGDVFSCSFDAEGRAMGFDVTPPA
jgi:hypothetical protein